MDTLHASTPTSARPADAPEFFRFPTTSAQQRIWFLEQFHTGSPLHNVPIAVRLEGELDVPVLEWALNEVVRRHESLRTSFARSQDVPVQIVAPALHVPLPVRDLSAASALEREAQAFRLAREQAVAPFDLGQLPLLRAQLLRLTSTEHIFVLTVHHIIFDGWSLTVFFRDIRVLYTERRSGQPFDFPELPIQYADFAVWQHDEQRVSAESLAWWHERLGAGPVPLELPSERPRPAVASYRGAVESLELPASLHARLNELSRDEGATLFMTLLAGWFALLHRLSGQAEIFVGSPVANRAQPETESLIGLFINTLVLRGDLADDPVFRALLFRVRETVLDAIAHAEVPFEKLVEAVHPERSVSRAPLVQVMFVLEQTAVDEESWPGLKLTPLALDSGTAKLDLTLYMVENAGGLTARLEYSTDLFDAIAARRMLTQFCTLLEGVVAEPDTRVSALPLLTERERHKILVEWNETHADYPRDQTIHELFAAQVARTPDAVAVIFAEQHLTYGELAQRAEQLADHLRVLGTKPGALVGVCLERSLDLMVALLGILRAGGTYLPLDPKFPADRLAYIVSDAHAEVVLTQQKFLDLLPAGAAKLVSLDTWDSRSPITMSASAARTTPEQPAYVLYTSGSTGKPKGVAVSHRNVVNFFAGMDRALGFAPGGAQGCWLAVTTISFDISVLELFWTLTRGFKVVIQPEALSAETAARPAPCKLDFSLSYFASEESDTPEDKYRLLMEGAKFADTHGFTAVWTPERHFHSFGGLFPNPSVTGAAIAVTTENVAIRAGSVVLPLHHPIRVAEEWAVVDNLSHGRAGVAFASGWHDGDFVLAPQNFARRKEVVFQGVETVRKLWRGEAIKVRGGKDGDVEIKIHPRPVQTELPIWIAAAGNPETFRRAGESGLNVITHLLGQSLDELASKIARYREAWHAHGHTGEGRVALMLHTFVGTDLASVKATVHEPLCAYLKDSVELIRTLSQRLEPELAIDALRGRDLDALVEAAFDRYFESCGLFGTPETCARFVERLQALGVDEVACLIDFGIAADTVLAGLEHLHRLKELNHARAASAAAVQRSVAEQIVHHGVTHLQCTPSLAKTLVADPSGLAAVRRLKQLLLGGEALPVALAEQLHAEIPGRIYNMYGPTETTVWSAVHRLEKIENPIPIGRPIANTRIYILDRAQQPVPIGVAGELFIGGDGVALGYLHRPELTAEKFLPDPVATESGARMYRTGDLARFRPNGVIEFLGRVDHQMKLRGHRIELGEIETVIRQVPEVRDVVVVAREDTPGDPRLVAYFTVVNGTAPDDGEMRASLRQKLPDYMVPAAFVPLAKIPLTPNGKIDRRALPAPTLDRARVDTQFAAPQTGAEQAIAAVWEEVLAIKQPGVSDNFFDLGGHSLNVVQVQGKLRERLHRDVPLLTFFQNPTIRSLAHALNGAESANGNGHGNGVAFQDKIRARAEKQRAAVARPRGLAVARGESAPRT